MLLGAEEGRGLKVEGVSSGVTNSRGGENLGVKSEAPYGEGGAERKKNISINASFAFGQRNMVLGRSKGRNGHSGTPLDILAISVPRGEGKTKLAIVYSGEKGILGLKEKDMREEDFHLVGREKGKRRRGR